MELIGIPRCEHDGCTESGVFYVMSLLQDISLCVEHYHEYLGQAQVVPNVMDTSST